MIPNSQPQPIHLRTRHDASLAAKALESRAETLDKLADKNEGEGYYREARGQKSDAATIRELILPAFREQGELPLVTPEQIRGGIAEGLRSIIRNALIVRAPEEKQEDALQSREDNLLEQLALRVEGFAEEVASIAYEAGYAARESAPNHLVHRALHAIKG